MSAAITPITGRKRLEPGWRWVITLEHVETGRTCTIGQIEARDASDAARAAVGVLAHPHAWLIRSFDTEAARS